MNVFGLTGGIGMGKSTAEKLLRQRGVSTIDTDCIAREIVEPGQPALDEIQSAFGKDIVSADGKLRRDALAQVVFSDPVARQKLEGILHPRIRDLWKRQIESWRAQRKALAVVIIPLLFETGGEKEFTTSICLACSAATQRQRLQDRGWSSEDIQRRVAAQWPIDKKMSRADHVIWTEGPLDILAAQLGRIIQFA